MNRLEKIATLKKEITETSKILITTRGTAEGREIGKKYLTIKNELNKLEAAEIANPTFIDRRTPEQKKADEKRNKLAIEVLNSLIPEIEDFIKKEAKNA